MRIVRTAKAHVNDIVRIGKSHWFYEEWITKKYIENTLNNRGFHFTAFVDGKIAGSIMVVEEDIPKFWIFYFIVDKNYRRTGIGTALLKRVTEKMKKDEFLFVDLAYTDRTGMNFYKNNNFKVMGKVNNWFEKGKSAVIMAKKI
ncbi:MAG: N-Terminal Acetyltransferase [archaeon GW2011_AR5]|nr:MAG: N-Terminal Acetyltransferase [archaeon GW2011_AR5]